MRNPRDLQKLAFVAQALALDFILPSWITVFLGALFFPLFILAFAGKRWVFLYLIADFAIGAPQMIANFTTQIEVTQFQIQILTNSPSHTPSLVLPIVHWWKSQSPFVIAPLLGISEAFAVYFEACYVYFFYYRSWERVKMIRERVPKQLWA